MKAAHPVCDHFKEEASFWRDVYSSRTIEGAIYGQRQKCILAFVDALRLQPGALALEVGCGAGLTSLAVARRGYRVCATDLVEEMAGMTRALAAREGVADSLRASCADAETLPFPPGIFDLVIGNAVLEWVSSPPRALAEMARVLRPGGYLVVTATNLWGLQRLLDPWLNPFLEPWKRRQHSVRARAHSRREVVRLLESARLQKEASLTTGFGPFTFLKFKLFPGLRGVRLHEALEQLAARRSPLLRNRGYAHVFLARK